MRAFCIALACLGACATIGAAPPDEASRNLAVLRLYGEYGQRGEYDKQAALWADDAVNNGRAVNPREIRAELEDLHRTFPDLASVTVDSRATGDTIVVLSRTSGTHRGVAETLVYGGMLKGARPTGKRFEVLRSHWWRFKDGKIVWHQVVADDLSMMRQLGLIPDTLPGEKLVTPGD